ncbi:MAG: LLM class flavin-dependent oxidoreductase [Dehalococcoidia bacterium]
MKLAVTIGTVHQDWEDLKAFAVECERIGINSLWSAEHQGHDAFTPLAYLAPLTARIRLGTGVVTLGARSPAAVAMAAMSVASMSSGRLILGLGAGSRPTVEHWHGTQFHSPPQNLRETIDIVRLIASGAEAAYSGSVHSLPGPGGSPLRVEAGANASPFPVYVAALTPKSLGVTGEKADGWVGGMTFMPEIAHTYFDPIAEGAQRVGRKLADIDLMAPTFLAFGDVERALRLWKPVIAGFLARGVGPRRENSHVAAYVRAGLGDVCSEIADRMAAGDQAGAAAAVPDSFVLQTRLVGDDHMVRDRVRAYRAAGVTTLQVYVSRRPLTGELPDLARLKALVDDVTAETPATDTVH